MAAAGALGVLLSGAHGSEPEADPLEPALIPTVVYVSEVPYPLTAELGNPLELWARKLSSGWASALSGADARITSLKPELDWDSLKATARTGKADAFVVHGYEFDERGREANLVPLLVPCVNNRAAMVEFVLLRRKPDKADGEAPPFRLMSLDGKKIRVDRAGCGELVYRWLDCEILTASGDPKREYFADFYSAKSAAEAVLDVYFGQMEACVVSREDYLRVLSFNRAGISDRLEEARRSPPFLKHIIAGCTHPTKAARSKELQKAAMGFSLNIGNQKYTLAEPKPEDMKNLRELITKWNSYFGKDRGEAQPGPEENPAPEPKPEPRVTDRRAR